MKAKYIILSLLGAAALLFGCAKEPITGYDNASLKVDNSYVRIDTLGGNTSIKLTAKESWNLYAKVSYEYSYKDTAGKTKKEVVDTLITPGTSCKPHGIKDAVETWITADPVSGEAGEFTINIGGEANTSYRTADVRIVGESGSQIVITVAQGENITKTYNVRQVIDLIKSGKAGGSPVMVKGIICKIDEISTSYGNATYYLSDDGTFSGSYDETGGDGNWFEVYRGYWLGGEKFTKGDEIAVGDEVTIKGTLTLYKGIPETNQNDSEVIEIKKSLVAVSPSSFSVSKKDTTLKVAALYSGDNLNYAIDSLGKTFLSIVGTTQAGDTTFVEIHVAKNTDPVARTGVVSLSSTKGKSKSLATVTVTQEGDAIVVNNITEALEQPSGMAVLVSEALVSAKTTAGFIATDGSAAVYVYDFGANTVAVGDKVKFAGIVGAYNGVPQLATITNLSVISSGNTISYPVAKVLNDLATGVEAYTSSSAEYVCFYGTLKITFDTDGTTVKYANIEVDGADKTKIQGSITKPTADLGLAALNGKVVTVKGYYNGKSGSKDPRYHNVVATSVEEGVQVPVTYKYKKVTAVTSGKKYLIAAVIDGSAKVMNTLAQSGITKTFGYLKVTAAEVDANVVIMADEAHEFTFTQSGGGYTIVNSEGKYIYQNGTYKTYNESATSNENCVWTVSITDGEATITSPGGYTAYYDTEFNSYGAYNDTQDKYVKPWLFEKM